MQDGEDGDSDRRLSYCRCRVMASRGLVIRPGENYKVKMAKLQSELQNEPYRVPVRRNTTRSCGGKPPFPPLVPAIKRRLRRRLSSGRRPLLLCNNQ